MIDFITGLIPGVGPALWAIGAAVLAIVWGFVHGGTKKKEGIKLGQAKAENIAIKKDVENANKIESAADAARTNDAGGMSAIEKLAASGRLRKPKNRVP